MIVLEGASHCFTMIHFLFRRVIYEWCWLFLLLFKYLRNVCSSSYPWLLNVITQQTTLLLSTCKTLNNTTYTNTNNTIYNHLFTIKVFHWWKRNFHHALAWKQKQMMKVLVRGYWNNDEHKKGKFLRILTEKNLRLTFSKILSVSSFHSTENVVL